MSHVLPLIRQLSYLGGPILYPMAAIEIAQNGMRCTIFVLYEYDEIVMEYQRATNGYQWNIIYIYT